MTRWTCLTNCRAACSPAPTGPAPGSGCGPARAGPGRPGQRHGAVKVLLDPPASGLPAGGRDRPHGVPRAARRCRQTGSAEQPGGSNRQLGRSKVPDNMDRGTGRSSRPIQAPKLTRQRLLAIRHRPYPAWHPGGPRTQQQRRLPRRAPPAPACPKGLADTGQGSTGTRPGGLDPRPDPGQEPADQRQHQDREQPPTKSHGQEHDPRLPDQPPVTPGHTPSATSAVPDPASPSIDAPPSRATANCFSGRGQHRVPTPE